jgi:hypothetical protein
MVGRLSLLQLFLAFAVATARNDPPPSLPNHENGHLNHIELGSQASWVAQRTALLKKAWLTNAFETASDALLKAS